MARFQAITQFDAMAVFFLFYISTKLLHDITHTRAYLPTYIQNQTI